MFRHYRIGFMDYDRTLYPHSYPTAGNTHKSYMDECYDMLVKQKEILGNDKPLKCMQWAVSNMQEAGAVVYVLTHEIFNLRDEHKKNTALRDYGISKYLSVDSPEHKVDMMLAVAKVHNVNPRDCLFIDDKMSTVYRACEAGIAGMHVSSIYQMYEEYLLSQIEK